MAGVKERVEDKCVTETKLNFEGQFREGERVKLIH